MIEQPTCGQPIRIGPGPRDFKECGKTPVTTVMSLDISDIDPMMLARDVLLCEEHAQASKDHPRCLAQWPYIPK